MNKKRKIRINAPNKFQLILLGTVVLFFIIGILSSFYGSITHTSSNIVVQNNLLPSRKPTSNNPPKIPFDSKKYGFTFKDADNTLVREFYHQDGSITLSSQGFGFEIKQTNQSLEEWWETQKKEYYEDTPLSKPCSKYIQIDGRKALMYSQGHNTGSSSGGVIIQDKNRHIFFSYYYSIFCDEKTDIPTISLQLIDSITFTSP